jgi:hypothetical protein
VTVFLAIGAVGLVLLLLSVVVGDHLHGVFDVLDAGDWLTGAGLAGFLGALGFVGALVLDRTDNVGSASAAGVVAGLTVGALVGWITLRLKVDASGHAPSTRELVGVTCSVIVPIPAEGFGQVRCGVAGHLVTLNARADAPVPSGTEVWITESLSPTSVRVRPTRD